MNIGAALRFGCFGVTLPWLLATFAMAQSPATSPGSASATSSTEPTSAEELDRPGEVENPFTLNAGTAQIVSYVLAANRESREANELGDGGSAVILQTGVRFGVSPRWEGQVFADTYLNAIDKGPDGDDPGHSKAGLGFLTLRAKVELFGSTSDAGLALVPFVRFTTSRSLTGITGAEPGLIIPFDFDLEHGWEVQGSTSLAYGHGDGRDRTASTETQASLEWHFAPRWTVYVEPEFDGGEGRPNWALEQGVTVFLSRRWQFDVGFNTGLGHTGKARFGYLGLGFVP